MVKRKTQSAIDVIVEDIQGNLWVAAVRANKLLALEIDPDAELVRWGSVYWATVLRIDNGLNAAFVDLGYGIEGYLPAKEIVPKLTVPIGKKLKAGQMIAVQIKTARQPSESMTGNAAKLSLVSMDIALQGRFMIHTPLSAGNRVSRRVTDPQLRKQMQAMARAVDSINGCILRAASASCQTDVLIREGEILKTIWDSLQVFFVGREPTLLMLGPDALQRVLSDLAAQPIANITVASQERMDEADTWCDLYAPEYRGRLVEQTVQNTRSGMGLFETRDLLGQVERLVRGDVEIPNGAMHIDLTEACVVIDVNASGKSDPLSVNLDAADEIARQLRLRNIGGLVVIDFAGNLSASDAKQIKARLDAALAFDPATVECYGPSKLGLFELARNRRTPSLMERVQLLAD